LKRKERMSGFLVSSTEFNSELNLPSFREAFVMVIVIFILVVLLRVWERSEEERIGWGGGGSLLLGDSVGLGLD
jgi:hypothetical protein